METSRCLPDVLARKAVEGIGEVEGYDRSGWVFVSEGCDALVGNCASGPLSDAVLCCADFVADVLEGCGSCPGGVRAEDAAAGWVGVRHRRWALQQL